MSAGLQSQETQAQRDSPVAPSDVVLAASGNTSGSGGRVIGEVKARCPTTAASSAFVVEDAGLGSFLGIQMGRTSHSPSSQLGSQAPRGRVLAPLLASSAHQQLARIHLQQQQKLLPQEEQHQQQQQQQEQQQQQQQQQQQVEGHMQDHLGQEHLFVHLLQLLHQSHEHPDVLQEAKVKDDTLQCCRTASALGATERLGSSTAASPVGFPNLNNVDAHDLASCLLRQQGSKLSAKQERDAIAFTLSTFLQPQIPPMPLPHIPQPQTPPPQIPHLQIPLPHTPLPQIPQPQIFLPEIPQRQMPLPQMTTSMNPGEMNLDQVDMPSLALSQMAMPHMNLSQISLPEMTLPSQPSLGGAPTFRSKEAAAALVATLGTTEREAEDIDCCWHGGMLRSSNTDPPDELKEGLEMQESSQSEKEKRERQRSMNREASRRMRQRRATRLAELESAVLKLKDDAARVAVELGGAETEVARLEAKERTLKRKVASIIEETSECDVLPRIKLEAVQELLK